MPIINEAIILAGGLGTRLRSEVSDVPKCLAPVNGIPFLSYLIKYLTQEGIRHYIFSIGYKKELVIDFLERKYKGLSYSISSEDQPLGTGGAIRLAGEKATETNVLICNGDTLYKADITELAEFHLEKNAECTIALKPMTNFERYGSVTMDQYNRITAFNEKTFCNSGLINGGIYILKKPGSLPFEKGKSYSFENDFLKVSADKNGSVFGCRQDRYFIDIGIPEDYRKAATDTEFTALAS